METMSLVESLQQIVLLSESFRNGEKSKTEFLTNLSSSLEKVSADLNKIFTELTEGIRNMDIIWKSNFNYFLKYAKTESVTKEEIVQLLESVETSLEQQNAVIAFNEILNNKPQSNK